MKKLLALLLAAVMLMAVAAAETVNTKETIKVGVVQLVDMVDSDNAYEGMLATIKGGANIKSFSPSKTAERTLMDNAGIYANYTAELEDGTQIAGRVHATCLNKVLYTVHLTYPRAYTETYIDTVYATLRKTLNITQ